MADALTRAIDFCRGWAGAALWVGVSPGLFLWPLLHRDGLVGLFSNRLDSAARLQALGIVSGSLALTALVYLAVAVRRSRREGPTAVRPALQGLNRRLLGLIILPFVPPMLVPGVESAAPWTTLFAATGAAVAAVVAFYRFPWAGPSASRTDRTATRWWPAALGVAAVAAVYAIVATIFSVNQHHSLRSAIMDLGVYDNVFWQSAHGKPLGCSFLESGSHLTAHADPLLVLLSPVYLFYPRAEMLLGLQSVWLASIAIPLFLLARRQLGRPWHAFALAAAGLLHPALHGANFYEFHSLSLVAPLAAWAIYFIETGAVRPFLVILALMLLTREDVSILACFIGLSLILQRRTVRLGILTVVVSAAYLVVVKLWVMPDSGSSFSYLHYYGDLVPDPDMGLRGLLISVLTHPTFVIRHALAPAKLLFLFKIFLPLLFLPFLASRGKVMLVYGLAFALLASRPAVFSVHFQYASLLYPVALALVPIALAGLDRKRWVTWLALDARRLVSALVVGIVVASASVSVKYGGLVPNEAFRAGFQPLNRRLDEAERAAYQRVRRAVGKIPPDAGVAASIHLGAHVSNRRKAYEFPWGWGSDYVFVDVDRLDPWSAENVRWLRSSPAYEVVDEEETRFVLLRRVPGVRLPPRLPRND